MAGSHAAHDEIIMLRMHLTPQSVGKYASLKYDVHELVTGGDSEGR